MDASWFRLMEYPLDLGWVFDIHIENLDFSQYVEKKTDTDDMRESASIVIINALTGAGAMIAAYNPKAY